MGLLREAAEAAVDVDALDEELVRLAGARSRLRLRIGRVAEALLRQRGHHELGFSSVRAYAYERLGCKSGWVNESRRVWRQLEALPHVHDALLRCVITWRKAALLGRHATSADEEVMLAAARQSTVRELEEILADVEAMRERAEEDELGRRSCTVVRQVDVETFWACEVTSKLVDHLESCALGDGWIEHVLAEATSTMQNAGIEPTNEAVAEECARWIERRREGIAARQRAEAMAEERAEAEGRPMWQGLPLPEGAGRAEDGEDEALPSDPQLLDRILVSLAKELASADLWLGASLERFKLLHGWERGGFASFDHYVAERLGLSRTAARDKMKLAREIERLPALGDAVRDGRIEKEAARVVARVANVDTVESWLTRAERRTYKHLREEVEVAETLARAGEGRWGLGPPDADDVEAFFAYEREVLSGELLKEALESNGTVRMCDRASGPPPTNPDHGEGPRPTPQRTGSPPTPRGRREIRLRIPEEVFVQFRMMEVAYERAGFADEFLSFLCGQFWWVWAPTLGISNRWEHIYNRDRYKCRCPVCFRRDLTAHHLKRRSQGGGDEDENLAGICAFDHLELIHGGRMNVRGPASRIRWELGRTGRPPVVVVVGRERVAH